MPGRARRDQRSERAHALYYLTSLKTSRPHAGDEGSRFRWLKRSPGTGKLSEAALFKLIRRRWRSVGSAILCGIVPVWDHTRFFFTRDQGFLEAALALPHSGVSLALRAQALCGAGDLALRQGTNTTAAPT